MSVKHKRAALYFNELAPIRQKDVVLAGHLYSLEDEDDPFTRMMICRDGVKWNQLGEYDSIATSVVAYIDASGRAVVVALGRDGEVLVIDSNGRRVVNIPADPGFLFQLCRVGDDLYACGSQRQVWRMSAGQWGRFDAGLVVARRAEHNPILYAIHGLTGEAIYAGGKSGELFKYDGQAWVQLDSPTSEDIERILAVSPQEVYFCGKGGILFRGHDSEWEMVGDPGYVETFWGLTAFQDRIFVASLNQLFAFDGSLLLPIAPPTAKFSYHRLGASSEYLWATSGEGTVARWDGQAWELFLCPDN